MARGIDPWKSVANLDISFTARFQIVKHLAAGVDSLSIE